MDLIKKWLTFLLILFLVVVNQLVAQKQEPVQKSQQVITKQGFEESAPAVVKIVADEGRTIGAGVILGVQADSVGFVLTSYSMIAGRVKVAVILKNYAEPLLGHTIDKWIDFDSDLAIVAIKNFPPDQRVISLKESKSEQEGDMFTIIGHTELDDWMPIPTELILSTESNLTFRAPKYSGIEGGPVLNEDGNMIGLIISREEEELEKQLEEDNLVQTVKTSVIKPIIKDWFQPIQLQQQWSEKSTGIATWIWVVGGGVLGGGIATAIVIAGGGAETPRGLPRPPQPPRGQ